jgi:predicted nucleic acid-binding protein
MFVLDTNVLSELMNPAGSEAVLAWADAVDGQSLFTTAVNQAEILYGLAVMAKGRRRSERLSWAASMFSEDFRGRILPFEEHAAAHFAEIAAGRRQAGRRIEPVDAQIAAIVRAHGMTIVTRDAGDFSDCGIDIINPWLRGGE